MTADVLQKFIDLTKGKELVIAHSQEEVNAAVKKAQGPTVIFFNQAESDRTGKSKLALSQFRKAG